jgi:YHS domain-containing protein
LLFLMRLLAFLGVLWLLRRILGIFLVKSAQTTRPRERKSDSTDTVKDPVCGMYMDPRLALRLQHKDSEVFFCSEACRRKYEDQEAGRNQAN